MYFRFLDLIFAGVAIFEAVLLTISLYLSSKRNIFGELESLKLIYSVGFFFLVFGSAHALLLFLLRKSFPVPEGDHKMKGYAFTVWKVRFVIREITYHVLKFYFPTFGRTTLFRILGASIGTLTHVSAYIDDPEHTQIGSNCILGRKVSLSSHFLTQNRFYLKSIKIGNRVTIGLGSLIMAGVEIGDDSIIAPGSVLLPETKVPSREIWSGNPAMKIKKVE